MRKILAVSLCVALSLISLSFAQCPSADLSGDYFVNFEDYACFAQWWLDDCNSSNNFCDGADFDLSSQVDTKDLDKLANQWLSEPNIAGRISEIAVTFSWAKEITPVC